MRRMRRRGDPWPGEEVEVEENDEDQWIDRGGGWHEPWGWMQPPRGRMMRRGRGMRGRGRGGHHGGGGGWNPEDDNMPGEGEE